MSSRLAFGIRDRMVQCQHFLLDSFCTAAIGRQYQVSALLVKIDQPVLLFGPAASQDCAAYGDFIIISVLFITSNFRHQGPSDVVSLSLRLPLFSLVNQTDSLT
jgi:hypothetical protein